VSTAPGTQTDRSPAEVANPWPALWALCLGFFMILVDSTIVTVATPVIIEDLGADVNQVVWVTSAYLLAYAVPLLITGRLGDRFGQKRIYLVGLTIFTLASLWCGLTASIEGLIVARIAQGLGASLMAPQTMATITRIFPAARRGQAMSVWGATAGVALLVGPILGGVLVDGFGWEWIFFINVPVGVLGFVLAARLVPQLPTSPHQFDWVGVALSGVGMFLLVFGIQEGHQYDWGQIAGPITVWRLIGVGLAILVVFVVWEAKNTREPLVPLSLFRDRNFSVANVAISGMGFAVTALGFPIMLYAQLVLDLSPTRSALLLAPMAIMSIVLAPFVGRLIDSRHPRYLALFGYAATIASMVWTARVMTPDASATDFILPMALLGLGSAFVWGPTTTTANRNLPLRQAGAGAGVYNSNRQVGAVLGSAAIALVMDAQLSAQGLASISGGGEAATHGAGLPAALHEPFSTAMSQAMLLPPAVLLISLLAVVFFVRPGHQR
jgi:EmrB/QacA subfamily drug resistance transporter